MKPGVATGETSTFYSKLVENLENICLIYVQMCATSTYGNIVCKLFNVHCL